MKQVFSKYIIIIISFYAIWIVGLPFLFPKTLTEVCENISLNSNYEVSVVNPKLRLSLIPTANILKYSGFYVKDIARKSPFP